MTLPEDNQTPASLSPVASNDPQGHCAVGAGSADSCDDDDFDNGESNCHVCLGEGTVWGEELDDPDWYEPSSLYKCPCCGGTGHAKDCTYW